MAKPSPTYGQASRKSVKMDNLSTTNTLASTLGAGSGQYAAESSVHRFSLKASVAAEFLMQNGKCNGQCCVKQVICIVSV